MVETGFWLFESGFLCTGLPNRFVCLFLQCIIQRGESKGRLQMPDSAPLSLPVQRSTGESNWHQDTSGGYDTSNEKTIQFKFSIFRCLLLLSVLISLHNELAVAMGTVFGSRAQSHLRRARFWQHRRQTKP